MKNEPAYPVPEENLLSNGEYNNAGLTKRELFAIHLMPVMLKQMYILAEREKRQIESLFETASFGACEAADALIKELEK